MNLRKTLFALAIATAPVITTSPAAHADDAKVVAAEALFNEGRALLDKGRFEEACERFTRSQQIDPAVGTLLSLGECYEKLDKIASAWGAYRQAAALAQTRNDDRRASLARRAAANIEPRLARLAIAVEASPPGLVVSRNGIPVDAATLDTAVPVDAGPQEIVAAAPSRKPWKTTVDVAEGASETVRIPQLEADASATPSPREPGTGSSGDTQRRIALGLEIGGGAVLVGGLVFGSLALGRWSSIDERCPNKACPPELASDVDAARSFATISTIGVGVGAAALLAGVVLHLTAPERRVALVPVLAPRSVGLVASFGL